MKILLPVDGSDCSNATLTWVAETFNARTTEYYLLMVIPVIPDLNTVEYDILEATALLRKARLLLEAKGCLVVSADYAFGDVTEQIGHYAEQAGVEQVVLGSHGRSGLAKILMGSTSIKMLEHSSLPVTIHRDLRVKNSEAQKTQSWAPDTA